MKQVLIALDQLANTFAGGWADETLSARLFRLELERGIGWPRKLLDAVFFWQEAHCHAAWVSEMNRTQLPRSYH